MADVEIEYCSLCGTLSDAQTLGQELLDALGGQIDGVEVTNLKEHVFRVRVDGDVVYEDGDEEIAQGDIEEAVRKRLGDGGR